MSNDSIVKMRGKMGVDMLYSYGEVFCDDRDKSKVCTLLMDMPVAPLHLLFSIERSIEQRSGARKHVRKREKRGDPATEVVFHIHNASIHQCPS
jgi:hypothetical protein